jgi:hypothetical protein
MLENIEFQGVKYPARTIMLVQGEQETDYLVSSLELQKAMIMDGNYISQEAMQIDDRIAFFVSDDDLKMDESELANLLTLEWS